MSKQYTAKDNISPECYRGTREQWTAYLRDTSWYSEYVDSSYQGIIRFDALPEPEWMEMTLDENLIEWDEEDEAHYVELDY